LQLTKNFEDRSEIMYKKVKWAGGKPGPKETFTNIVEEV
jgi:hypothetical protein